MATEAADDVLTVQESDELEAAMRVRSISASSQLAGMLMPLASLRVTVGLFAISIFLIFAGTLAQAQMDVWEVVHQYFRVWFAWIDLQVFFPKAFFAGDAPKVLGGFWFPGGFLIGAAMGMNLLAAHALRFKVQSSGPRLAAGLAVIALGVVLTWMVVLGGSDKEAIEGFASFEWSALWKAMKWSLVALWCAGLYGVIKVDRQRPVERWTLVVAETVLGAVLIWIFSSGEEASLGASSMRILWQLIKGGLAGLVLLAGCWLVFRKRAGIVLLHAGVALVMANELVVYSLHVESQMQIREGETVDYVFDVRAVELALVDPSNAKMDDVLVVPRSLIESGEVIHDEQLPCDIEVVKYLKNSTLVDVTADPNNLATAGTGLKMVAEPRRAGTGTDSEGNVDRTAAYVKLIDKHDHKPLGTYLVSVELAKPQKVDIDGKTYELAMRFKRNYKPYSMKLADVRFDKYVGTQTAKNYSSDLRLSDSSRGVDRDVKIWMNNPLRFAGETFYQSSYFLDPSGREGTILQVVTNTGWMIPYVACMLVATGMLAQFSVTLLRFLRRRRDADPTALPPASVKQLSRKKQLRVESPRSMSTGSRLAGWYFPATVVLLAAAWVASAARPVHAPITEVQIDEFGRLPVAYEGRVKPFDTVARNMLRYLSGKQFYIDDTGPKPKKQPAMKWFLDVVAHPELAQKHKIFRIENPEVLETLGLQRRDGFRYSLAEISPKFGELERQAELASKLEPAKLNIHQKKMLELVKKRRLVELVAVAFDPPELRPDHAEEDLKLALRRLDALSRVQAPLAVPPDAVEADWETFAAAWFNGLKDHVRGLKPSPAMVSMTSLVVAYSKDDAAKFNEELAEYEKWLDDHKPKDYDGRKVAYEAFFNSFEPFYCALVLYPLAFVLVALGWLGWTTQFNRAAFALIVFALCIHTFALVSRVYISGRPPVINLYSTAVFIGWGAVILGLILEMVYRIGIGLVIASAAGFATLLIANFLAGLTDGDTLGVLQAVLDTQFWLATHVVCINLGYATTYVAGLLGIVYIVCGVLTRSLTSSLGKDLGRMIYGVVCFAMFFSFVGTVLGGLWADDSWGRFWGWDPKENGALMIVLWNALILHARWGGLVKERGMAMLAVAGNVVVSWSYFGVNELGVGLHSYGFTEGVLLSLGVFTLTQVALIGLAALPRRMWWSTRPRLV